MLRRPPEGDSLKEAQKKRGVTDGRKGAADIGDQEDEEGRVESGDAVSIHPYPGADEQHGGSRGADDTSQNRTNQEEEDVLPRGGFTGDPNVDPPRHNEESGHNDHETDVLMQRVK